jgi:CheY-like chemotaxis protein
MAGGMTSGPRQAGIRRHPLAPSVVGGVQLPGGGEGPSSIRVFLLVAMRTGVGYWDAELMTSPDAPRCVIVDDSRDFASAARRLLEQDGILVVDVASTGSQALRCLRELRPDVMLIDIDLGAEDGFELTERLHRSGSPTPPPLILISTHNEEDLAELIASSPAVGFVAKAGLNGSAVRAFLTATAGRKDGDHR